jgi:hypothetical protein
MMASIAGADDSRVTICPACGYPRLGVGLCAACVTMTATQMPGDTAANTFASTSGFTPAA